MLILLFSGSITASIYLSLSWIWLAVLFGIGLVAISILFLIFGLGTVKGAWQYRRKVAEVRNQQSIFDDIWTQQLAFQEYGVYYQQILIPQVIEDFQKKSRLNGVIHTVLQLMVITTSLLVTGFTSGLDVKLGVHIAWIAPALSTLVSFCTAIIGFFKFRERSFHMQQTADSIEQEKTAYELGIRHYKSYRANPEESFAEFAERVEHLREDQRKRQQQLEQASATKEAQVAAA